MEIRRFYIKPSDVKGNIAEVSGEEFTHAVKVLRQKVGYRIILNTGDGIDIFAEITEILKNSFVAKIVGKEVNEATPTKKVTLYQGSCKQGKNDFIVQKAVELGVSRIVFFDSEFVAEKNVNAERLLKIAVEAMKQCGRADFITLDYIPFNKAMEAAAKTQTILFYEGNCQKTLKNCDFSDVKAINIVIGSEGGFSEKEIAYANSLGIETYSLGKRVLRAETASVVGVALVTDKIGGLE